MVLDPNGQDAPGSVGILALVPEAFDRPTSTRHHLLTRLARRHPVVWMNPARHWRKVFQAGNPPARIEHTRLEADVDVYEPPPWLPNVHRPAYLEQALDTARLRAGRARLIAAGARRIVLYLWRPEFARALDRVEHDVSIYHIDDEYSFSDSDLPVGDEERDLIERVDRLFIHSPGLLEKKGGLNPRTVQVPNGVDFEALCARSAIPSDLEPIASPRIGFTGWLKNQLDWGLIDEISAARPDWSFVFAGAALESHTGLTETLTRLGKRANVHMLGAKTSGELSRYPGHFDVCVMPYRVDGYTHYIYPLKLHEYLATGRPVVASPIRTVQDFSDVVTVARGPTEWIAAIERALAPAENAEARVTARTEVARAHDWDRIHELVEREIADELELHPG